jgi:porin
VHWGDALPGRLVLGGWGSTSNFTRFDGSTTSGTAGFYSIVEQALWRRSTAGKSNNNDGLTAFMQYGHADGRVSPFVDHVGGGLTFVAPLVRRPYDTVAVGATYVHLSDEPGAGFTKDFELSIEGVYGAQVTSYLLLQPDIQYIIHPGGNHPDAVVATLRATLTF